jgi:hypothetical protein
MRPDPPLPDVFTVDDAQRAGLTRAQIETRVSTGRWHRIRRGVYCLISRWSTADDAGRHRIECAAVIRSSGAGGAVLSHSSAALLHDVPVSRSLLDHVVVTVPPGARRHAQRRTGVVTHVAGLPDADRREKEGLPVTSLPRTVADCLRVLPAEESVPIADAALRKDLSRAQVEGVLARQARWPFVAAAVASLALVDPRRESWLESTSAVVMHRHGLPVGVPQVRILDGRRRFVARVDFAWLNHGVVGEADGRVKYGGDAARTIEEEKDRHAKLEALGLVVVRWGARHLHGDDPVLVQRLRPALAAGDPSRFRGMVA